MVSCGSGEVPMCGVDQRDRVGGCEVDSSGSGY
jgi:hypothetical protein